MAQDPATRGKSPLSWKQVVTLVGSLGYVASPVDLIPDVLAPFGLGDDAVAVVIASITLVTAVRRFRAGRPKRVAGGTQAPQVTAKPRSKR
ncbi:YkvA family protein [Antribacter gilvus]|uniref:YkvA family protein n=1 Tax=Antribacter gilvus TaxID=2304675 RepID=UPI000F7B371C|nr:YkvA family protein [Antribacter gilvus]